MNTQYDPEQAAIKILTESNYLDELENALTAAHSSINIAMYMLSLPKTDKKTRMNQIINIMIWQAKAGLKCQIILADLEKHYGMGEYNNRAKSTLAEAGWKTAYTTNKTMLHSKIIVIDNQTSIIGSHNMSESSLSKNIDTSLLINHRPTAAQLTQRIGKIWSTYRQES